MNGASPAQEFTAFYERWETHVRLCARALLPCDADAEDVAHLIFQRLWASGRWKELTRPRAYLQSAARAEALREIRRQSHVVPLGDGQASMIPAEGRGAMAELLREESWSHIERSLVVLPQSLADVVLLTIRQGLTRREAAERLGITLCAVEKRLTRAYRDIRDNGALPQLHEALSTLLDGGGGEGLEALCKCRRG